MPCTRPFKGWRPRTPNVGGLRPFSTKPYDHDEGVPCSIPCGTCPDCRAARRRTWAIRCMHEASLHEENSFVTLTYDEEHLPPEGSLRPAHVTRFLKRLRRRIEPRPVRYLYAGEYGSRTWRPHYHAILFGWDWPDKQPIARRGEFQAWTSPLLTELWPYGLHEIGSVTYASAAYVAGYVLKKAGSGGSRTSDVPTDWEFEPDTDYGIRYPEYARMSRDPGLGAAWADQYEAELLTHDSVIMNATELPVPEYYLRRITGNNKAITHALRLQRANRATADAHTTARLAAHEAHALSRANLSERGDP